MASKWEGYKGSVALKKVRATRVKDLRPSQHGIIHESGHATARRRKTNSTTVSESRGSEREDDADAESHVASNGKPRAPADERSKTPEPSGDKRGEAAVEAMTQSEI